MIHLRHSRKRHNPPKTPLVILCGLAVIASRIGGPIRHGDDVQGCKNTTSSSRSSRHTSERWISRLWQHANELSRNNLQHQTQETPLVALIDKRKVFHTSRRLKVRRHICLGRPRLSFRAHFPHESRLRVGQHSKMHRPSLCPQRN